MITPLALIRPLALTRPLLKPNVLHGEHLFVVLVLASKIVLRLIFHPSR